MKKVFFSCQFWRAVVSLCCSQMAATATEEHGLGPSDTLRGKRTQWIYPYHNLTWNPGHLFLFVLLVAPSGLRWTFPSVPSSRALRLFLPLRMASGHFLSFHSLQSLFSALPPRLGLTRWGHQWSLWIVLHNKLLKDGFLSLTQRDTVRRHFPSSSEHGGPQGKAYCPQIDPTPLWFCLFKWDS